MDDSIQRMIDSGKFKKVGGNGYSRVFRDGRICNIFTTLIEPYVVIYSENSTVRLFFHNKSVGYFISGNNPNLHHICSQEEFFPVYLSDIKEALLRVAFDELVESE